MTANRLWRLVAVAASAGMLVTAVTGCSTSESPATRAPSGPAAGEVTVFAAASLKATFTEIGAQFQAAHPGTTVRFNFAGSSDLVAQLQQGAAADVLAPADARTMDRASADTLLAGEPTAFATNTLMIAVPPDNPAGITSFADLAGEGVQVVVCAPQVPCGAATQQVEANTGVTLAPVSEESSVADVLNKVATGEADAGVVYVTDVRASDARVLGVPIPAEVNAVNTYPIAALAEARAPALAAQFEALVLGAQGQQVLADAGFGAP